MEFLYQDIPEHGVLLVPVSSPDYDALLAEIVRREANPTEGSPPFPEKFRPRIDPKDQPTSAILLNRSTKAIVGLHAIWQSETESGRSFPRSRGLLSPRPLLLPFGMLNNPHLKVHEYWNTILPGSSRYIAESGLVGDNRDVRPPADEEKWRGGMITGRGGGGSNSRDVIVRVTLMLDGIFFRDGEFIGPDTGKMFEQTVAEAEAHRLVARIARQGHDKGSPATEILCEIERLTGAAPEHPPMPPQLLNRGATGDDFLKASLESIAYHLGIRRRSPQFLGDEQAVQDLMRWDEVDVPRFHRS